MRKIEVLQDGQYVNYTEEEFFHYFKFEVKPSLDDVIEIRLGTEMEIIIDNYGSRWFKNVYGTYVETNFQF